MEILWTREEDLSQYGKVQTGKVYSALVSITDVSKRAEEMIKAISDTSWINDLDVVSKTTFEATSKRTIEKLVKSVFEKIEDTVTVEFGEYMVSDTAQIALESEYSHSKLPLAELLKEKVAGNPGFDFHTESAEKYIAYGEAKYSGSSNPYTNALTQITEFIDLKKDDAELLVISKFVSQDAIQNHMGGRKAYVAAFSVNSDKPDGIVENALKSEHVDSLLTYPEVYVIGVKVDAE